MVRRGDLFFEGPFGISKLLILHCARPYKSGRNAYRVPSKYPPSVALAAFRGVFTLLRVESGHRQGGINGGAIIDHEAPRERRFVAVEK